jgi:ABC-type cobalamin/Fe3+-siderophores transport system ATPase subunit
MRYFNTSGPCFPGEHYTVLRKELIAEGMDRVHKGKFITIFAPRQAGKTTYFRLLIEELKKEGKIITIRQKHHQHRAAGKTKKAFHVPPALSRSPDCLYHR